MTKNTFIALVASLLFSISASAQKTLWVGFYNQENLFDTIDDPHKNDNEFLPTEKKQWNTEKYRNKINHMAKVIASMNDSKGADVLGMCEVENDAVLTDLVKDEQIKSKKYAFVHFDSPDDRSIDNALIYQSKKFKLLATATYKVTMESNPHFKTRDILLVKLQPKESKEPIVFLVNHFPSRVGGEAESAGKRATAATVLRSVYDSIVKANPAQHIVIMGDFNDEPTDSSIKSVLKAKGSKAELTTATELYNAMYDLKMQKQGSLSYRNEWNMLDQIMMSGFTASCYGKICYRDSSAAIYKQDWMIEQEGKYKGTPLRTFGGQKYTNGYSDHFPVYVVLELRK